MLFAVVERFGKRKLNTNHFDAMKDVIHKQL